MKYTFTERVERHFKTEAVCVVINDQKTGIEIGSSESHRYSDRWHLSVLYIERPFRRRGLSKVLLVETCKRLWDRELLRISVDAVPQDGSIPQKKLNELYEKAGFIAATDMPKRFRLAPPQNDQQEAAT